MAQVCQVTGKRPMVGNRRSKAMNATKRRFKLNLHYHRIWVPSEGKFIRLRVTPHGLRILDKVGIETVFPHLGKRKAQA